MKRREFIVLVGGAAFAWPHVASAQQAAKRYRLAFVHPSASIKQMREAFRTFFVELQQLGYVEDVNLVVDRHSAEGSPERFVEVAHDTVGSAPDVIITIGDGMAQAFKETTNSIAIVAMVGDPVAWGLTASLAHPASNLTGVVSDAGFTVWEKRFELLRAIVPTASNVAFPFFREGWNTPYGRAVEQAALRAGMSLKLVALNSPLDEEEFRRGFAAVRDEHVDALAIADAPVTIANRQLIVSLVEELRLPTIYPFREFVDVGGLMAYSPDLADLWRHAALQVNQILKGAKPSEIPFYQATKFELVINLKIAKALGLTVPPSLLVRADEVIE